MREKKNVFRALETMLSFYEGYRVVIGYTRKEAIKRTLEVYSDFYKWLQGHDGHE